MTTNFDSIARGWDDDQMHVERAHTVANMIDKILNFIPTTKKLRAMEYGAGTGLTSFYLQDKFLEIVLIDNSKAMLEVLSEKISAAKLTHFIPRQIDINVDKQTQPIGKFDVIYMVMTLHHIPQTLEFLKRIYLLLNPDGYLFIADIDSEDGSFHNYSADVINGFNREELAKTLISVGFQTPKAQSVYNINKNNRNYPVFLISAIK